MTKGWWCLILVVVLWYSLGYLPRLEGMTYGRMVCMYTTYLLIQRGYHGDGLMDLSFKPSLGMSDWLDLDLFSQYGYCLPYLAHMWSILRVLLPTYRVETCLGSERTSWQATYLSNIHGRISMSDACLYTHIFHSPHPYLVAAREGNINIESVIVRFRRRG